VYEDKYGDIHSHKDRDPCNHHHVAPAGFPTGALICLDCKRLIDPKTKMPLEAAITEAMKCNHIKAEQDKKLWD